jgi:four helix bundle protein
MREMGKTGLENLLVWQKARELAVLVCKELLPELPSEEKFALGQQLRRSVQSVPANIAEAYGRYSFQDAIRFLYIARGSLEETFSHLILMMDLEYSTVDVIVDCIDKYKETARLLNGYIDYLKQRRKGDSWRKVEDADWEWNYEIATEDH